MPNAALKDNLYDKDSNGGKNKEKYTALAMQGSRLKKARTDAQENGNWDEFNRLGGDDELNKLEGLINTEQKSNHSVKKISMDAGKENVFKKTHTKDRDNSNPTGVGGIPQMGKGSIKNKIMTNKEVYNEEISKEISEIRYLIEYMNNNKKLKL